MQSLLKAVYKQYMEIERKMFDLNYTNFTNKALIIACNHTWLGIISQTRKVCITGPEAVTHSASCRDGLGQLVILSEVVLCMF